MASKWLTEAEARARFGDARVTRLADADGDGVAETGAVDSAIERAESMVEAKLLTRYAPGDLPVTTVKASLLLKEIVGGFFIWCLTDAFEIRGEDITLALRTAERRLDDVCRGTSSLLLAGAPPVDLSAPEVFRTATTDTLGGCSKGIFSPLSLRDF